MTNTNNYLERLFCYDTQKMYLPQKLFSLLSCISVYNISMLYYHLYLLLDSDKFGSSQLTRYMLYLRSYCCRIPPPVPPEWLGLTFKFGSKITKDILINRCKYLV